MKKNLRFCKRDKEDETIFPDVMLRMHDSNLQAEIEAFVTSLGGADVTKEVTIQLTERQRVLLHMIQNNPQIAIPEMSRKTAVTERTIKRDLADLQAQGILRRVGGRKEGYWQVLI